MSILLHAYKKALKTEYIYFFIVVGPESSTDLRPCLSYGHPPV